MKEAARCGWGRSLTTGVLLVGSASACADGTPPHFPDGALLALWAEDGRLYASWPAAADDREVDAYRVTVNGTLVAQQSGTEYAIGEAPELATLRVSILAVDAAGNESAPLAAEATMPDRSPPTFSELAHVDLTASGSDGEPARTLTIAWTAATDNAAVTGYEVRAGDALLGTTHETRLEVPGVALGPDYAVSIVALDAADLRSAPLAARWGDSRQAANEALRAVGHCVLEHPTFVSPEVLDELVRDVPAFRDVLADPPGPAAPPARSSAE